MSILITIIQIIAGIIILFLLIALLTRKAYNVQREIIINAPIQKVFDYLKHFKNQEQFNKWVMLDPDMKKEFKGTDGTVGFTYGWNGNKRAGEGEQEIKSIVDRNKIETEIRFVRPIPAIANASYSTESLSPDQTKVRWGNTGKMKFPMNVMASMIEKMLAKDMDESLSTLKNILEK